MDSNKETYAQSVCYFLAELLRNHKVGLKRAGEISQKVLANINLIDTEVQFLKFIKDISLDFQELIPLTERINIHMRMSERQVMESQVREFVLAAIPVDLGTATDILHEAVKDGCTAQGLCGQFPQFKQFIETHGQLSWTIWK